MERIPFFSGLFLCLLFACKTSNKPNPTEPSEETCKSIVIDLDKFNQCNEKLDYNLDTAYIEQQNLFVKISYSGGCEEHEFDFLWDRAMLKSYPPQFRICLAHDAKGDNCEAYLSKTLCMSLNGLENPIGIIRLNGWKGRLQFGNEK